MADFLQYGEETPEGILAILYRALWAMAEVRAKLSRYEDTGLEPEEVMALAAPQPTAPLTLEELREMDRDWVWIEWIGGYLDGIKKYINGFGFVLAPEGYAKVIETKFLLDAYGKTWLAYRRKPEEGTTDGG